MSLRLQPYAEYRDSGLIGLDKIPSHWEVRRLDRLFTLRNESPQPDNQRVTAYLDGRVTLRSNVAGQKIKGVIKEAGWQQVYPGDFAISGMNAHLGGMGVSDSLGKCSPIYLVLKPYFSTNAQFVSRAVRHIAMIGVLKSQVDTIRFNSADFKREDLKSIRVWLPSDEEQQQIVGFLDRIDHHTYHFIRAKRRFIELLNEQKQLIIRRAVTRGINHNSQVKLSGIGWVPEIPKHWSASQVKREFECLNTKRVPLSASERGKMRVRAYDYYGASGVIDKVDHYLLDDNLLLIAEDGANLVLRNLPLAIIAHGKFWVNNHAHILKPRRGNLEFLASLMEVVDYRPWISGAAQPKLTQARLMAIPIPVPPVEEQDEIAAWIRTETSALTETILSTKRENELIREYHTRLIADVITGNLDVRRVELPAADEAENVVPLDQGMNETLEEEDLATEEESSVADE